MQVNARLHLKGGFAVILQIYGRKYRIDHAMAASAKKAIRQALKTVRAEADVRGIPRYYTAFVVMMYVTSASILEQLGPEKLKEIAGEAPEE